MQDLIQNYVSDLHKFREVFHKELEATAEELSKAMALYAKRCDAALESFMEKLRHARASLNRQRRQGLVSSAVCRQTAVGRTSITDRLLRTPSHSDAGIAASAERAVADSLHVESDRDRKPQPARSMTLVKSGPAASSISPPAAAE